MTALRRARAYARFPELLLEHPSRAESAFRGLMLRGIAVRDADEWQEHHMASVASMESRGGGGGAGDGVGGFVGGGRGGSERVLDGLGGQRCWVGEIDDSAVAIVEVATNTNTIVGPFGLLEYVESRCKLFLSRQSNVGVAFVKRGICTVSTRRTFAKEDTSP